MQNVISRIKATHFIEIIKGKYTNSIYQDCYEIMYIDYKLKQTDKAKSLKTIAVFKIKLK